MWGWDLKGYTKLGFSCIPFCSSVYGGLVSNSQFPMANLPLPVGCEMMCGFRWGLNVLDAPLRSYTFPEYLCMLIYLHCHSKVQVLVTCQGHIISSLSQTSPRTADQRWHWHLWVPLMWICVWTLGLRTRGHKPNQHEGSPFNATGW